MEMQVRGFQGSVNMSSIHRVPNLTANRPARSAGAFTLIELLVVVSIVALLVSILLPSLKRAREQAKQVVCLANLKAVALASLTYAESDQDGQALPVHPATGIGVADVGSYDWGGKAGAGEPTSGDMEVNSVWGTQFGRGPATRPLNELLFKAKFTNFIDDPGANQKNWIQDTKLKLDQFRCPSDKGFTGHHFAAWENSKLSSYDHYGTSYAANTLWCNSHGEMCVIKSWGPFLRPITRVANPAGSIYYIENCGRFAWRAGKERSWPECWTTKDGPHFCQSGDVGIAKGWHGRNYEFQLAFIDAHADLVKIDGFHWPPPTTPVDPVTGNKMIWQCHVLRGPGWQMDVLPSPPIFHFVDCNFPSWPSNTLR